MANIDELKYNFDVGARGNLFDVQFFLPSIFGGKKAAYQTHEPITKEDGNPVETTSTGAGIITAVKGGSVDEVTTVDHPATWSASQMGIRVESCSLPGRTVDTKGWSEQGAERQMPTGKVDDGGKINFTFICDQSFADRLIIEAWQSIIYSANGGNSSMPKFAWYDDYKGEVKVIQHRKDRKDSEDLKRNALEYRLFEAYPISFDEQALDQNEKGIMKFKCTLAYRYWESKYIPAPERSALNKGRVILDALLEGSNLLSRFGKEGKIRKTLTNLDTRTTQINNLFGGG